MGWATPQKTWLAMGSAILKDFLTDSSSLAVLPGVQWDELKKSVERSGHDHDLFWRIINLEMWFRVFCAGEPVSVLETSLSKN
jgi:hypothetical protein